MEVEQLSQILLDRLPVLVAVALFTITAYAVSSLWNGKSTIPLLDADYGNAAQRRKDYMTGAAKLYQKGYDLFRHEVYRMTTLNGKKPANKPLIPLTRPRGASHRTPGSPGRVEEDARRGGQQQHRTEPSMLLARF